MSGEGLGEFGRIRRFFAPLAGPGGLQLQDDAALVDCAPGKRPLWTRRSASTMRRATISMSPKVRSAAASATIGGTTVTGIFRFVAAATSIFSGVMDCEAIIRSFGFAAIT